MDPALGCHIKTDVHTGLLFLFFVFVFGGHFFKAFCDLVPEISCAKIKGSDGSRRQEKSREI